MLYSNYPYVSRSCFTTMSIIRYFVLLAPFWISSLPEAWRIIDFTPSFLLLNWCFLICTIIYFNKGVCMFLLRLSSPLYFSWCYIGKRQEWGILFFLVYEYSIFFESPLSNPLVRFRLLLSVYYFKFHFIYCQNTNHIIVRPHSKIVM